MPISAADVEIPPTAGLPLGLGDLFGGGAGADFPGDLATFLQVPQAGIACSGTASLVLILQTLRRMSARRSVIIPAYTCPLVVFAIVRCGLQVRLCDLAADSFELCPESLQRLCGPDTLAILPTHLGGRVARIGDVAAIAHACGAFVVEDAAQSLGARTHGRTVGLAGDAAFFSLAAGKGLSLYEGGAWIARDPELASQIARTATEITPHDPLIEGWRILQLLGYAALYRPGPLRFAYGAPLRRALARNDFIAAAGDEFSAVIPLHRVSAWRQAVGARALRRLPDFQAALAARARARFPRLQALPGIKVFADAPGDAGTWPFFLLLLPDAASRDAAMAELWGSGLGVARMFAHALPDYAYLQPWVPEQDCPRARDFAARSMTVSNSLWLDDEHFERIIRVLAGHRR